MATRDDAGLAPFAVAHVEPARCEVAVGEVHGDGFGAADAGIQQREENRPVATAERGVAIAAGEERLHLGRRERGHDLLGYPHVAQTVEGIVLRVAGRA